MEASATVLGAFSAAVSVGFLLSVWHLWQFMRPDEPEHYVDNL